jgi:hypothetical protein
MLFALIHLLAGTVLSGVLVTVVVATPALFDMGKTMIPLAVGAGIIGAIPVAWVIARAMQRGSAQPPANS